MWIYTSLPPSSTLTLSGLPVGRLIFHIQTLSLISVNGQIACILLPICNIMWIYTPALPSSTSTWTGLPVGLHGQTVFPTSQLWLALMIKQLVYCCQYARSCEFTHHLCLLSIFHTHTYWASCRPAQADCVPQVQTLSLGGCGSGSLCQTSGLSPSSVSLGCHGERVSMCSLEAEQKPEDKYSGSPFPHPFNTQKLGLQITKQKWS